MFAIPTHCTSYIEDHYSPLSLAVDLLTSFQYLIGCLLMLLCMHGEPFLILWLAILQLWKVRYLQLLPEMLYDC